MCCSNFVWVLFVYLFGWFVLFFLQKEKKSTLCRLLSNHVRMDIESFKCIIFFQRKNRMLFLFPRLNSASFLQSQEGGCYISRMQAPDHKAQCFQYSMELISIFSLFHHSPLFLTHASLLQETDYEMQINASKFK